MPKYMYKVLGVDSKGRKFISSCIENDIIKAITHYRNINMSVHEIERQEQCNANIAVGIANIAVGIKHIFYE